MYMTEIIQVEPHEIERDDKGHFKKGVSANPAGRPKGSRSRATLLREQLDDAMMEDISAEYYEVLKAMIKAAKDGDVQAGRLVLKDIAAIKPPEHDQGGDKDITVIIQNYTGESDASTD